MVNNLSAAVLFWCGIAALPAYLLQTNLVVRFIQVVLFAALTKVAGKRLQWAYFLSIIATITLFHVIVPSGAVIAEIGGFRLTAGALRTGVFKALTIVGLVFISLVSVRADLRLPGRLGSLVGKIFWSFEQIMERRESLDVRRPFRSADGVLVSLYDELVSMDESVSRTGERKETARRSSAAGRAVAIGTAVLQWALLIPA
jgi:heptaprenyl diphosphate synthase